MPANVLVEGLEGGGKEDSGERTGSNDGAGEGEEGRALAARPGARESAAT